MDNNPDINIGNNGFQNNVSNNNGQLGVDVIKNDLKKYIEFEFSDFQKEKNNYSFDFESPKKAYIITKEEYEKIKGNNFNNNNNIITINNIFSSKEEIENLTQNNIEFLFVNEEFFKKFNITKNSYENKFIYFYAKENKINILFINEKFDNIIQNVIHPSNQIKKNLDQGTAVFLSNLNNQNSNQFPYNGPNNKLVENKQQQQKILKKLILLYAFEKHFYRIFNKYIKDEYDINEYYLINYEWIEKYKNEFYFNLIKKRIDEMKLKFSYKGFVINLDKISQNFIQIQNVINPDNLNKGFYTDEKNFLPEFKNEKLFTNNNIYYPNKFVLVNEKLFDLFYEEIKNPQHKKEKYKFNVLIGDSILFIQNQIFNQIFYCYLLSDNNNFDIYYLFTYNEEQIFYEEVNTFIKDQSLMNYLMKRNINYDGLLNINDIYSEHQKIGAYINYKEINTNLIITEMARREFVQNTELYYEYNKFIHDLHKLQDNNISILKINDIQHIKDFLPILIISNNELEKIKKILFFEEIQNLSKIKNKEEYNKQEKSIINNLVKDNKREQISNYITNLKKINSENIDNYINNNANFSLISKNLFLMINKDKDHLNNINILEEAIFFINNKEYFIYYISSQNLYKLNFIDNDKNKFSLIEKELESEYKDILKVLTKLYNEEKLIKYNVNHFNLNNLTKPKYYYAININWMNYFKKVCKYDLISVKENGKKILSLLKKEKFPSGLQNIQNLNNLFPNYNNIQNFIIPYGFELIEKNIFESLIQEISKYSNFILPYNNLYEVSFGDNKIFIKNNDNKLYFIYSGNNYQFEYLIQFMNNIDLINYLQQNFSSELTFEEFISYFGIDLTETNIQFIIDDNLKALGLFLNYNKKQNIVRKDPKHCLGLENIGATCYMNATLQCLCHVFNMKNYFQNKKLVLNDINNKDCPLTFEFYKVINNLWQKSYHGKGYYTPRDFKNKISEMNPLFKGIAANDSKDLIIFLYETIHNEINNPNQYFQINNNFNNYQNNDLQIFRQNYYTKNYSFLINTFYFEQQTLLHCFNCQFNKLSYNIANILIFPLEKVREYMIKKSPNGFVSVTLDNCFQNYQEAEVLSGQNQIYCNNCKQMANATTGNQIFTVPQVMTIILNRGKGLEFDVNFEYPLKLNIDNYIVDKSSINNNYELICVLTHIGPSGMAGHFIAFCKSPTNGKWYCYNDADVSEIDDPRYENSDEIETIPYVLFYQKMNPNSPNQNNFNTITLYIQYNEKQFFLTIETDFTVKKLIKKLNKDCNVPKNVSLYYNGPNNLELMDESKNINEFNLSNETILLLLDN